MIPSLLFVSTAAWMTAAWLLWKRGMDVAALSAAFAWWAQILIALSYWV